AAAARSDPHGAARDLQCRAAVTLGVDRGGRVGLRQQRRASLSGRRAARRRRRRLPLETKLTMPESLETLVRSARRALVVGVGGGGDVVGALVTARFLEFCGVDFRLGGLSWERSVYDPLPGPRALEEVENVRPM